MTNIAHLLLAAGGSRRMGRPKPLLPWKGQTLLAHQLQVRLQTKRAVAVVLGGSAPEALPIAQALPVTTLVHTGWVMGMGGTIAFATKALQACWPNLDGLLLSLLDQPLVTAHYLEQLTEAFEPGRQQIIVSKSRAGWQGAPVLFDRHYFHALTQLKGDEGAKSIVQAHPHAVHRIDGGHLLADMDTPEAYAALNRQR